MDKEEKITPEVVLLVDKPTAVQESDIAISEIDELDSVQIKEKALKALRIQRAKETRKANTQVKRSISRACKTLLNGTFCTLEDGEAITCAEILAINLLERAMSNDKSLALLGKLSGDLSEKDDTESGNNIEEVLKIAKIKF